MPCNLNSALEGTCNFTLGSVFINNFLKSPIWLSAILTVLIVVLIMSIYPAKKNTGCSVLIKLALYIFIGSNVLMFLHDNILRAHHAKLTSDGDTENLMNRIGNPSNVSGGVHVNPDTSPTDTTQPEFIGGDEFLTEQGV
jgi:hypothetical protein